MAQIINYLLHAQGSLKNLSKSKFLRDGWAFAKNYFLRNKLSQKVISRELSHQQKNFAETWEFGKKCIFLFLNYHKQIKTLKFPKTHYKHIYGSKSNHQKLLILA
jgi:hypothetical protein